LKGVIEVVKTIRRSIGRPVGGAPVQCREARPPRAWPSAPSHPAFGADEHQPGLAVGGAPEIFREGAENDARGGRAPQGLPAIGFGRAAFTLIEMLAVIAILGIIAALAVPGLKNIGKSNAQISASRQMLDAVARARQLAMVQRTTVYMVFVPTNFWTIPGNGTFPNAWWNSLNRVEQQGVTNLVDRQLSGYAYVAYGRVGDQPGQHTWHYLSSAWQTLPDGNFIAAAKFGVNSSFSVQTNYSGASGASIFLNVTNFTRQNVPFPDEYATNYPCPLPCLAFDYTGRLVSEVDSLGRYHDAYIPLAQGTVGFGYDGHSKTPQLTTVMPTDIQENPPGNSTNISYNLIHVDALTGRATQEYFKIP